MDRLSSYASRESESEPSEDRQQTEQDAVAKLLGDLRIAQERRRKETEKKKEAAKQPNGEQAHGDAQEGVPNDSNDEPPMQEEEAASPDVNGDHNPPKKHRGIPDNIKLYEVFYDQVTNLVNVQRLHIQDTIALLVSLAKLAL